MTDTARWLAVTTAKHGTRLTTVAFAVAFVALAVQVVAASVVPYRCLNSDLWCLGLWGVWATVEALTIGVVVAGIYAAVRWYRWRGDR